MSGQASRQVCSAWWMNDDREGTWGPLVLISPTREPNRERRPLAGGSSFCYRWVEPSCGVPREMAPPHVEERNYSGNFH